MKHFAEYLRNKKKEYNFIIRVAGPLPENFENDLERSLNKYEIVELSKTKTTPISESSMDFPRLRNIEVTHFELTTSYPAVGEILENQISNDLSFPSTHIVVRGENEPMDDYEDDEHKDEPYEAILTKTELDYESAQEDVGANRVMNLLAELETARKEREADTVSSS